MGLSQAKDGVWQVEKCFLCSRCQNAESSNHSQIPLGWLGSPLLILNQDRVGSELRGQLNRLLLARTQIPERRIQRAPGPEALRRFEHN